MIMRGKNLQRLYQFMTIFSLNRILIFQVQIDRIWIKNSPGMFRERYWLNIFPLDIGSLRMNKSISSLAPGVNASGIFIFYACSPQRNHVIILDIRE